MLQYPYILQAGSGGNSFSEAIQEIQTMPQFFEDAIQWGLDASYYTVGFMCVLAIGVSLFKR